MTKGAGCKKILFIFCLAAASAVLLFCSRSFAEGARKGIELCAERLIPSLFPSMVIAEIAVASSLGKIISKPLAKPISRLFNISREAVVPFLLGMIFGFPVSVRAAVALCNDGKIDESELCRLALFSVIPSPAFFISAVGEGLFGSLKFGIFLYLSALLSCVTVGVASRRLFKDLRGCYYCENLARGGRSVSFVSAVTSSARALFAVCSFVVLFSAIIEPLSELFESLGLNKALTVLLLGTLEMTNGASLASTLGASGAPIAAAILGFSGISLLCQLLAIDVTGRVRVKAYIVARLFIAGFMLLFSLGFVFVFGESAFSEPVAPSFILYSGGRLSLSLLALFLCALFMALYEGKRKIFGKTIYKR